MLGRGAMSAVLRLRPDTKELERELRKDVPDAMRKASKEAEGEARKGFKKVGEKAGEEFSTAAEKAAARGWKQNSAGRWIEAKTGRFVTVGELAGAGMADGIEKTLASRMGRLSQSLSNVGGKLMMGGGIATAAVTAPMVALGKAGADAAMEHQDNLALRDEVWGRVRFGPGS